MQEAEGDKSKQGHFEKGWAHNVWEWLKSDGARNLLLIGISVPLVDAFTGGVMLDTLQELGKDSFEFTGEVWSDLIDGVQDTTKKVLGGIGEVAENAGAETDE